MWLLLLIISLTSLITYQTTSHCMDKNVSYHYKCDEDRKKLEQIFNSSSKVNNGTFYLDSQNQSIKEDITETNKDREIQIAFERTLELLQNLINSVSNLQFAEIEYHDKHPNDNKYKMPQIQIDQRASRLLGYKKLAKVSLYDFLKATKEQISILHKTAVEISVLKYKYIKNKINSIILSHMANIVNNLVNIWNNKIDISDFIKSSNQDSVNNMQKFIDLLPTNIKH